MVHQTTIRTRPPLIHVIARFAPTGVRTSVCPAVVTVIAVTVCALGFMSKYSRDFIRKSSGVGTWSSDRVKCVANIVFNSSLFTPSINFEAIAKFRSDILSSGLLLLLSNSRSSKNQGRPKIQGRTLYSRAETIQQDVEYLASAVSLSASFRHYAI